MRSLPATATPADPRPQLTLLQGGAAAEQQQQPCPVCGGHGSMLLRPVEAPWEWALTAPCPTCHDTPASTPRGGQR